MKFAKAQALGNDFLIVDDEEVQKGSVRSQLAVAMCDRRLGIGADGLIFFEARDDLRFSMKLLNSDGSPSEISGNGLRCLGAYLQFSGRSGEGPFSIETDAGTRSLETLERVGRRFLIRSDLGVPRLGSRDIPFDMEPPSETVQGIALDAKGRRFQITALNMGNPQCIIFTDRLDMNDVRTYGQLIESHPRFPRKTNVEFVEVKSRKHLKIGIWERGAGETAASGTGSAASVVAACLNGKTDENVVVECPGGNLEVEYPNSGAVTVTGEACVVALGECLQ